MRALILWLAAALAGPSMVAQAQDQSQPASLARAPELGWQASDTEASFVGRLRDRSVELGQDCAADEAVIDGLAANVTASLQGEAIAGKPMTLEWRAAQTSPSTPTWLVASFDRPVRFEGSGFYALTQSAIGPFGLAAGKGTTRAMVALFGPEPAGEGRIGIVPLQAGPLAIQLSVAGMVRRCRSEKDIAVAAGTASVSSSSDAIFLVRDPFSFEAPQRTLASPDTNTIAEVYDGRYRLLEASSRTILLDREGRLPAYSPTGRFLTALNGDGYDVIDTVDGSVIAQLPAGEIGWENADSFILDGGPSYGAVDLRNSLVAGSRADSGEGLLDCTQCSSLATRVTIDLENDLAVRIGGQGYAMSRLSGGAVVSGQIDTFDDEIMAEARTAIDAVFAGMNAAPAHVPEYWNFRGGAKFSPLTAAPELTADAAFNGWLAQVQAAVTPVLEVTKEPPPAPQTLQVSEIGQWRGGTRLTRPRVLGDAVTRRLKEFGLDLPQPILPSFRKSGSPEPDSDMLIARRIETTVPFARGLFMPIESFGCVPEASTEKSPKIFGYFDSALQFSPRNRTIWLTLQSCKWTTNGTYEPNFYLFDSTAKKPIRLGQDNPAQPNGGLCDANIGNCGVDARLYANRYLLIWSRESRAMMIYDVDAHRTLFQQYGLDRGELLKEAHYSPKDNHVTQVNSDGSFYVYDTRSGERVLSGRYVDDEVVVWASDLRFDASPEGANYVNLRFPGQTGQYTFQQFNSVVRRPGLLREVLARTYTPSTTTLGIPPTISGSIELTDGRITGTVSTRGATEIRLYQDGLRTDTRPVSATGDMTLDVAHAPGARSISLVAASSDGLVSLPFGRNVTAEADTASTIHVLTIGVDRYAAKTIADLSFAARDAATFDTALRSLSGRSLALGLSVNLVDEKASPQAILSEAARIVAAAKAGETVVISFAGHGLAGPDGRFYMATSGTDPADVNATALAWRDLAKILVKAQARVVVFLDACHSGVAGTGLFAGNEEAADGMLASVPSGLLVFSASKGRQFSEEAAATGGGVFTNAVADVIARHRPAYDLDGNGVIEVSELYAGVKRRVSELTEGRQVPWLARNEMIGDFALF